MDYKMLSTINRSYARKFLSCCVLTVLVTVLVLNLFSFPFKSQAATVVSSLASNAGKNYIQVEGKPFNPLAVQLRIDRMIWLDGKTLADTANYYPDAKKLGFNTILIPLPWSQM